MTQTPPRQTMRGVEYARRLGVTHAAITHSINRGEIIPLANGLIDVAQADAAYGHRHLARMSLRGSQTVETRTRALMERTKAQTERMRQRIGETQDDVTPREVGQDEVGSQTTTVRSLVMFVNADGWRAAVKAAAMADISDLPTEAMRVTQ